MNTFTSMLLMIINSAYHKDTNYYIALELVNSLQKIDELSISTLAKKCQTSVASVNKFCRMLGAESFSKLKFHLKKSVNVRHEQIAFRLAKMSERSILDSIAYHALEDFDEDLFRSSIEQVVDLIHEANSIQLIGAYFPTSLALNFQEDLLMAGKFIRICPQKLDIEADFSTVVDLTLIVSLAGRIYEYNKPDFEELCTKVNHVAIISGYLDYPHYPTIKSMVKIPLSEDNEVGNVLILEIFRYIKYVYYCKYAKEFF